MDTQRMNAVLTTVRSPMCHQRPLRSSQQTTDQYCGHILPICNLRQFALIARAQVWDAGSDWLDRGLARFSES